MIENIRKLLEPAITEKNYKLDEIVYEKEGNSWFLRIIIDRDCGITVDDCVEVCKLINPMLDEADLIKDSYILDVCSKEKGEE